MIQNNNEPICYTIGHSNHTINHFIELLQSFSIDGIVDVRSVPYSNFSSQFNKTTIGKKLKENDILYVYLGKKIGGRYDDPQLLSSEGIVDYNKVRQRKEFKEGIQKVIELIESGNCISLMCSEKDPFDCHRFVLVSYSLQKHGIKVKHILDDGSTISNKELEDQLFKMYGQRTLFDNFDSSKKDELEKLYEKRNWDIAYSR